MLFILYKNQIYNINRERDREHYKKMEVLKTEREREEEHRD